MNTDTPLLTYPQEEALLPSFSLQRRVFLIVRGFS
jgi:hypothetical protein